MVKILRAALLFSVGFVLSGSAYSQQLLVSPAKNIELQDLSQELNRTFIAQQQAAIQLAPSRGWPISVKQADGSIMVLQGTNSLGKPIFYKTYTNTTAAATTQTNALQPGGALGLNLTGSSTNMIEKLGIWDGGRVLSTHQEFQGKTIVFKDGATGSDTHATHVAGTMIARGVYAPAKGMSYGATSLWSYDFNSDVSEMTAAAGSLLLSNHSYGAVVGWSFNSSQNRWEWYGLPGDSEDYEFGFYDTRTQSWDRIAYNAPYYLIVKSAGNTRGETGPAVGETYWGFISRNNFTLINKGPRPAGISSNDGYDILPTYSTAKNILSVAAVNPLPFGPANKSDISISSFSSWGPTDDGRIKPDISGMGVNVLSTSNSSNTSYTTLSGTSMASPNVTGSLNLLQEYYSQKNNGAFMRSSTLKGLVCHTAIDAGNTGPDYIYGWGLLNTRAAAQAITDNNSKSLITEATLAQGQTQTYNVVASGNGVLMATICWTDPEGAVTTAGVINDRTPKLVNDLDIRIADASNTFMPWVLSPLTPAAVATTGNNVLDNVEQVMVAGATPGKAYTITVSHKGTLRSDKQPYALIATGVGGTAYCASAPTSNADSRINNVTLSNINNTPAAGCTSYSDYTTQTVQLEQGRSYPIGLTLGTCGGNFNKMAKVYIDYNADGTFNPVTELAATTSVINGTGTYTGTINVPGNIVADSYSLMRVVLVETNDANAVNPCGSYTKGETQDYRVQFSQTATDAGVISVTSSTPGGACAGKTNIAVRLKNFGKSAISNIPVTVTVTNPDNSVVTLNETYTGTIAAAAETDFILQGTFNTAASATYRLTAATTLTGDPVTANNNATANVVTGNPSTVSNLQAYYCTDTNNYILSGNSDGGIFWYKNPNDATPFAAGAQITTNQTPVNNTFYAGVNDFSATVGPATKNVFSAGGYNQFSPSVRVSATLPMVIESARLYIGNSGQIIFTVSNSSGQVVSQSTINAVATRTTPAPGAQVNDPNDQGQVYTLNLLIPSAGTYTITANYDANATLYRNNGGVTGYPFSVGGGAFSIIGNDATGTNPNDTEYYKNFYYYFYDVKVKSAGCASTTRVPVQVSKPIITQRDTLLSSNFATGNQWYEDGVAIAGATGQTFAPQHSGKYTVAIQHPTAGCTLMSDPFSYAVISLRPENTEIGLAVFPVPAATKLNVAFKALSSDKLTISIINNAGQVVYTKQQDIQAGSFSTILDVSGQITGTYIVKVMLGTKVYAQKILVVR